MYNDLYTGFLAVDFIDDDPDLWGRQLSGLLVQSWESWMAGARADKQPEIWVSTTKIADEKTQQSLSAFGVDAHGRRLRISVTDLGRAASVVSTDTTAVAKL